jgi:hypothetical protein
MDARQAVAALGAVGYLTENCCGRGNALTGCSPDAVDTIVGQRERQDGRG